MKIRVEVEVGPKELREFLGLPDVSGLQQEAVEALSKRMSSSKEALDPLALLKGLVPTGLLSIDEWQRLFLKAARDLAAVGDDEPPPKRTTKKKTRRKSAGD